MMSKQEPQRVTELRAVIDSFLARRLNAKIDKLKSDDPKRQALFAEYERESWLADAAKRVNQIQLVTHVVKATHPDPKVYEATNLYVTPNSLARQPIVGSHVLGDSFRDDVTGNSAALDVFDFLTEQFGGITLLGLMKSQDADLSKAFSNNSANAAKWMESLAAIDAPRCKGPTSHTLAKQVYWPTADDFQDDTGFHLLSPLFASSLAHCVYEQVQDDRFGESAKLAREAKKGGTFHERPVREYPHMAVQQLGGTKPQNISQLNSERRGNNHLLASLPPVWQSSDLKPLLNTASMFHRYSRRPEVRNNTKALLAFLKTDPARNLATRNQRAHYVDLLIDELLQFTAELRELEPGWSQNAACDLGAAQRHWLDPEGSAQAAGAAHQPLPTDVAEQISTAFAAWLNAQLHDALPVGDPEFLAWRKCMWDEIKAFEREEAYAD